MGRRLPLRAEVLFGGYDPPAEQPSPEAIDQHSRREWVVIGCDPACKPQTVSGRPGRQWMERVRDRRFDWLARFMKLPLRCRNVLRR